LEQKLGTVGFITTLQFILGIASVFEWICETALPRVLQHVLWIYQLNWQALLVVLT